MRLHAVKHETTMWSKRQTYCGPGALSAILGISAEAGARLINEAQGKLRNTKVRGTPRWVMKKILGEHGITVEDLQVTWKVGYRKARRDSIERALDNNAETVVLRNDTLNKWMKERDYKTRTSVCLIVCGNHFVTVKGHSISDNQQGKVRFEKSKHKKKRVTDIWRLKELDTAG